MYFKCEHHKDTATKLMQQFGFERLEDNREYGAFCYIATATYKYNDLKQIADPVGINLDRLEQIMLVYSPSEIALIRFGLQLFNASIDDITIPELMSGLDIKNQLVVLETIRFRYSI